MAVCQFFLKGQCKFGDNCRNEHPANARQSGFGASSWNRGGNDDQKLTFPFSAASISNDLTPHIDKPIWPLSSYAPSKHEPLLVPGLDESPEELRVKAASAVASGNINAYLEYEGRQIAAADQTFANARNHSTQAYDQAVKQSEIPARLAAAASNTQTATSAFGNNTNSTSTLPSAFANTNPTTSTFGQSAFGQPTFGQSAFGQPAFGQPVQNPSTSATSTAPTQTNAFGQPLNNPAPATAFGQPPPATSSTPTQTGAFGQPLNNPAPVSAFGQTPPATSSVFGQPSALGTSSFIKPASGAFSAFNNTESAFGNNITTPATNTGGGGFSAFATQPSAFSLAAKTTSPTAGSTFGQPSFGQPAPAPFAPATSVSVFGNPAPAPTSVFGTSSAFGVPSQPQQPGQQEQQQQQQTAAPVWPSNNNSSNNTTHYNSTFGTTPTTQTIPPTTTKSSRTKSVFKPGSTPYDQQIPSNYKETLPKSVVQAFEDQNFEWGDVPEWVPPVEVR